MPRVKSSVEEVEVNEEVKSEPKNNFENLINKIKEEALKTKVVTLTYNDPRDNIFVTSAYLTCENQYFAVSRIVPLNVPVQLEKCLIDTASEAQVCIHIPQVDSKGKETGNSVPKMINKYTITYGTNKG